MKSKFILSTLLMTAALTFGHQQAQAGITAQISVPNVSININGYLPAPPGVFILYDSGRPYYIVQKQRVYMEKKPAKHYKKKKHNKGKHKGHN